jgi:heterodisulfide reductase subunit B
MKIVYYPGCSLEGTALEYDASTRAVMQRLGAELVELEDWTCCGASAAEPVSYLLSMALPARNLAKVQSEQDGLDVLVPCSACYLNLRKVEDHIRKEEGLLEQINEVLGVEGLSYKGGVRSRHLLDVLATDLGPERIGEQVRQPLSRVRVAPYYGCQALRPYRVFDDPEEPRSMEPILRALGAEVHPWSMGARCCGAGLMTTKKEAALDAVTSLLRAARGADCIVTVCPMCQMNLEAYQKNISRREGEDLSISILYLPQLMGFAFGMGSSELKADMNFVFKPELRSKLHAAPGGSSRAA